MEAVTPVVEDNALAIYGNKQQPVVIKGVPAKVCMQCSEHYFDDETTQNIEKIVNQLKQLSAEVTIVNYKEKVA